MANCDKSSSVIINPYVSSEFDLMDRLNKVESLMADKDMRGKKLCMDEVKVRDWDNDDINAKKSMWKVCVCKK
jgi:hypothetical protein